MCDRGWKRIEGGTKVPGVGAGSRPSDDILFFVRKFAPKSSRWVFLSSVDFNLILLRRGSLITLNALQWRNEFLLIEFQIFFEFLMLMLVEV